MGHRSFIDGGGVLPPLPFCVASAGGALSAAVPDSTRVPRASDGVPGAPFFVVTTITPARFCGPAPGGATLGCVPYWNADNPTTPSFAPIALPRVSACTLLTNSH